MQNCVPGGVPRPSGPGPRPSLGPRPIHLFIYLFAGPFICLFIYSSVHISIRRYIYLFAGPYIYSPVHISIRRPIYLFAGPYICSPVHISVRRSIYLFIGPYICSPVQYLFVGPYIYSPVHISGFHTRILYQDFIPESIMPKIQNSFGKHVGHGMQQARNPQNIDQILETCLA